ncbi:MAG: prepilin peptidase [Myxococcales bacterium]|nr:prepilin peptidase [Myxococcales bacterium]
MEPVFTIWLAFLGLALGSFLNVVIARVPHDESIVRPRSKCPKCGAALAWYDNIPVVSWLVLRGKCRSCKAPISPRYILVELLTGALFMGCLARFGWSWPLVGALTLVVVLVPLVFIDAEHWVLPFELTLPGIALAVVLQVPNGLDAVKTAALGVVAGFVLFRVMEFAGWAATGREALGAGDKYLVAMVLGFLGWKALLGLVLLASAQAAVVGVVRMRLHGRAHQGAAKAEGEGEGEEDAEDEQPARQKWTPAFLAPGLPAWKRVVLVPYALLFQDVPDPILDEETGEDTWEPQANNLPFGPWIGLAAIELMLLGPWLAQQLSGTAFALHGRLLFG